MSDATTPLYTAQDIQNRINDLAKELATEYQGKNPLLIGILKGSFVFMADLVRALYKENLRNVDVDFMTVSSYGNGTTHSGESKILHDITRDIADRNVLVVEDIIDSGHTLKFVVEYLMKKNPRSLKTIAFLDKKERREANYHTDYVGFTLSGAPWVEGYGLDGGEYGRGRPDIVAKNT